MPYTCPRCSTTSQDPNDELFRYCGRCHLFETDQEVIETVLQLLPQDPGQLPKDLINIAQPTIDHQPGKCANCHRPCWIGPHQIDMMRSGTARGICWYCYLDALGLNTQEGTR